MVMKGTWVERKLIESAAFRALSATAIRVLLIIRMKQRMEKVLGKRKGWRVTNNGEIEFTYAEAKAKWGIKQSAFLEARDRLIEVGFLDITHDGAGLYKSKTLYALSDRWKAYATDHFEKKEREKDQRQLGFQKHPGRKKSSVGNRASPPLPVGKEGGGAQTNGQAKRLHECLPEGHPLRKACEDECKGERVAIYRRHGKSNAAGL